MRILRKTKLRIFCMKILRRTSDFCGNWAACAVWAKMVDLPVYLYYSQYLELSECDPYLDLIEWWRHPSTLPDLYTLAKQILAVPCFSNKRVDPGNLPFRSQIHTCWYIIFSCLRASCTTQSHSPAISLLVMRAFLPHWVWSVPGILEDKIGYPSKFSTPWLSINILQEDFMQQGRTPDFACNAVGFLVTSAEGSMKLITTHLWLRWPSLLLSRTNLLWVEHKTLASWAMDASLFSTRMHQVLYFI